MNNENVVLSIDGAIATLTLNRPEEGNAIHLPLAQTLLRAAIRCDQDPAIRCVVLTGQGRLFCVGGDLGSFLQAGEALPDLLGELAGTLHLALSHLMRMAKPLVVLVNGPAAGAGLGLAICGDVVIAARSAHFTPGYGAVGLSPDGGLSWQLPRLIGLRRAQQMILLNRRVPAEEAEAIGLVTRVVDDALLVREGQTLAHSLALSATEAAGATRRLLLDASCGGFEAHLQQEARSIAMLGTGGEAKEGVTAFLERRAPVFHSGR